MPLTDEGLIHIPGVMSRWVRLASGARAHYVTAGDAGPAVVLLHGGINGSCGTAGWRFMMPFLAQGGFRVYAPDLPGYGLSDTSPDHRPIYGEFSTLEFVEQFVDALCLDRFHLSGNSSGAGNTAEYVVNHPERVISFAFIASFNILEMLGLNEDGKARERFPSSYQGLPWDGRPETMRENMEGIILRKESITDELVEMRTGYANLQLESHKVAQEFNDKLKFTPWTVPDYYQKFNLRGRLERLTVPGIYLYGMDDVSAPVEAGYAEEDILTNVQLFYPKDCGHQGQSDQPDMFNQVFLEFFRDGKVSRKTADWAGVSTRRPENSALVEQSVGTRV